jgi:hypothetical protein
MRPIDLLISKVVGERLHAVSHKTFDELSKLPEMSSEELVFRSRKVTVSVWHDVLRSGDHRIVVQAYRRGWLGIGRTYAEGFVVNSREEKRALAPAERWPFT